MPERGEIHNRKRARQLRDFTGLRWGNITPTDIDGALDFRDIVKVYMEAKVHGEELPEGQRKFLERECDGMAMAGKVAVVLVLDHDTPPEEAIPFATCPVREYRFEGHWQKPMRPIECKAAIDILLDRAGLIL